MTKHDSKTANIKRILELERVNSEHGKNLLKIIDYCQKNNIGRIGRSYIDELLEFNAELRKKNAELENIISVLMIADETGYVDDGGFVIGFDKLTDEARNILAIRDLEQQAKGIDLALSDYPCMYGDTKVYVADLENRAKDLREQAKQLKGGAK